MLAAGCSGQGTISHDQPSVTIDSSCTLFQPIITHGDDYQKMDIRTVRAINTYNDTWDRICGDKQNVQSP